MTADRDGRASPLVGWIAAATLTLTLGAVALAVDVPRVAEDIHSDEATYYMMGLSLARDGDLAYRRQDLMRVLSEFPHGPSGVFLKLGHDVSGLHLQLAPPFVKIDARPDHDRLRLFFGKSFIYPVFAAPFVWLFGTNGFYAFNSVLAGVAFLAAYTFVGARSHTLVTLLLSSAFILASVIPVYVFWMMPECFNFTLGLVAYFLWLYKYVAPQSRAALNGLASGVGFSGAGRAWPGRILAAVSRGVRHPASDLFAAALIGIAAFSKISNAILILPIVAWLLWRRDWRPAAGVALVFAGTTAALFAVNIALTGEWNYQGGQRGTFYNSYPFQVAGQGFDVGSETGRDTPMWGVIFDREMFWTNLRANLAYTIVGRYAGLLPYFCPALFATAAFLLARRRREAWQWFVLAGVVVHILFFIVVQPYTYFGGGGSLGNRYFIGAYGACLFLLPPLRVAWASLIPWAVGLLFVGKIVVHPFESSIRPFNPAKSGPLRWLPPELTNVNDLPIMNQSNRVRVEYGGTGAGDARFQIYHFDDNAYLPEAGHQTFWTRGGARAEFLIKTAEPYSRVSFELTAGPVPTSVTVSVAGRSRTVDVPARGTVDVRMPLGEGFPYKKDYDQPSKRVWVASITSSAGFTPGADAATPDTRYLGVLVKPRVFP